MSVPIKRNEYLKTFQSINHKEIKYQGPLILRMYGALNKVNLRRENRYILCNFLDQYSENLGIMDNIYDTNNEKSLNRLFLLAFNKAKESNLLKALYNEYIVSINAINQKKEI